MWSWNSLFGDRCNSSSYRKESFSSGAEPRLVEAASQIDGQAKERIIRVVKSFLLLCYCLALNGFMAYVMKFGINTVSSTLAVILVISFLFFIHLYRCENVEVDCGRVRTIRSFFYTVAVIYILLMLMCFASLMLSSERKARV